MSLVARDWQRRSSNPLRRSSNKLPDDVAIVGVNNVPLAEVFEASRTRIAQPMRGTGVAAAALLIERLAGGPAAADRMDVGSG